MTSVPAILAKRLDALVEAGVIAGWQDAGGRNSGLGAAPLPALIFPLNEGPASTFNNADDMATAVAVLERFDAMALAPRG